MKRRNVVNEICYAMPEELVCCSICGMEHGTIQYKGRRVCRECLDYIKSYI